LPESRIKKLIKELLEDLSEDIIEERVVNYIIRELRMGRPISEVLEDPYIKNRVSDEKLGELLQNKELISTVERELAHTLEELEKIRKKA
jgi:anaerobic ribonucleoside-triphosphate reductase